MPWRITASILVLIFGFICLGFSQEVKKDSKPAVVNDAKAQVNKEAAKDAKKPTTPAVMKFVSCSEPGCGFWAKSRSGKELRGIMKRHAKKYHKKELSPKQLKEMVKKQEGK